MLKVLRQRGVQRKIYMLVAVAIVFSFVITGVMLNDDGQTMEPLGKVGKRNVSVTEYLGAYRAVQHQLQFMFGERWNEMRRYVNLKGEAWDRILLYEEARRRGIKTSDREVVEWIAGQESFQRQGKYYPELYRMAVREALRMEPRDFEEEMRKSLTVQKLTKSVVDSIEIQDTELRELFNKERAARDIEYVLLPSDTQATDLTADEADIEKLYGLLRDRLTEPEKVRVSFVAVPKEEALNKKDALDDKSDLSTISSKYGLPVKTTAFFSRNDAVPEIGLSPEVLEAAFMLPAGGESPWIEHDGASFKIKVDEKQAERPLTLEESREEIRKQIIGGKALEAALKRLNEVKAAAAKDGLEKAVQDAGLRIQTQDGFKSGGYVPGIGPASTIAAQVSALTTGELSGALSVPGGAALVRVKKDVPPDAAEFEKEKENFRKEALARKSQNALKELLDKLRQNLTLNNERMKEIFPEEETAV